MRDDEPSCKVALHQLNNSYVISDEGLSGDEDFQPEDDGEELSSDSEDDQG